MMMLLHPFWLAALLLLPLPWFIFKRREYLQHSNVELAGETSGNRWLRKLPLAFVTVAMALLIVSLARPQERRDSATQVIKSRDMIVAVDISGSMSSPFAGQIPAPEPGNSELDKELPGLKAVKDQAKKVSPYSSSFPDEANVGKRRIDAAQAAVLRFVRARYVRAQGDRIGIEVFDTDPHWSYPLTDDLKMIYRKGLFIDQGLGGGTNFGNWEPGPIDAACEHFDERGQASAKVVILVTDGEDSISGSAMERLIQKLRDRNVRLYVIGVGDDARRADSDIQKLAATVGGQSFRVDNAADMAKCFDSIDQLERSPVEVSTQPTYIDIFEYFTIGAIGFFILALMLEALFITR